MKLLFDTETTGKLDEQARIVQMSVLLVDDNDTAVGYFNTLIKPDGFTIPDEMAAIHGITTERAMKYGVPIEVACQMFFNFYLAAEEFIGHNIDFDIAMIQREIAEFDGAVLLDFPQQKRFCTMKRMMNHCKLPGGWNGEYKWPKLSEAYFTATGEELQKAHNAANDLRATLRIYRWLMDGAKPLGGPDYGRFEREFNILLRRTRVPACAVMLQKNPNDPKSARFITGGEATLKSFLDTMLKEAAAAMATKPAVQPLIVPPYN
jgi:DNA polymerase-3 subunit epsilon